MAAVAAAADPAGDHENDDERMNVCDGDGDSS